MELGVVTPAARPTFMHTESSNEKGRPSLAEGLRDFLEVRVHDRGLEGQEEAPQRQRPGVRRTHITQGLSWELLKTEGKLGQGRGQTKMDAESAKG